ncbi:MAG: prolipoprotein diacylglyceryl transferase [Phycisphaerae bacterium]
MGPLVAHFVHQINPELVELCGIKLWYYGTAYALGFLGIHVWFRRVRKKLSLSIGEVYDLSILLALGVLMFGRAFEITVYEWSYYAKHPSQLLSYWRGGMASHGVLLGAVVGSWLFCRLRGRRFLTIVDEVVIPGAFLLALGRIGNFVNGQIYGGLTDVWWAVRFPDAEGFRHPVTLYESLKNLAIIPILLTVKRRFPSGSGLALAHFVFWYGFLRVFTDFFREYGTVFLRVGTGQYFNVLMAVLGIALIIRFSRAHRTPGNPGVMGEALPRADQPGTDTTSSVGSDSRAGLWMKRTAFIALLLLSVTIPSGWTKGVLEQLRAKKEQVTSPDSSTARRATAGVRIHRGALPPARRTLQSAHEARRRPRAR